MFAHKDTSRTASAQELSEFPGMEEKKGFTISFTKRVMLVSIAVSLITIISSVVVLSAVWNQHFQSYTRENVQRVADGTAAAIADGYEQSNGDWYGGALSAATSASSLYDSVYLQVRTIDGTIVYDDRANDVLGSVDVKEDGSNVASAPIMVDGEKVGTVLVRVPGSETLLTKFDEDFRDKSYNAMIFAALIALIIAMVMGAIFARTIAAPVKKITNAAKALKEGDYSARTGMTGSDEIARLGNMFDLMADSVESNRKLERRLVTDVAHELRTPLMAIQSTVEAMIDGVFKPDAERLETLNSEVQRLSRLVDALLKLSRLESRTKPIEQKKVDLTEMLSSVVQTHQAYIHDAGLNLEFEYDPHVYVFGDADLLRQATANLISNAVRYTPEGGTITIMARKGDLMGQIVVKDTGIGLTPEEAKLVFQRFWRADSGRARATGGLGIGLSVVKEIVEQHNGWVRVEGRPNEGACFTIYIPLYSENSRKRNPKRGSK
ncbi:MAG: ATP-binding protein [Eggerthellaceae bacterium]|nr:ATP-binding protein [Eggerthellaceae bacterium]